MDALAISGRLAQRGRIENKGYSDVDSEQNLRTAQATYSSFTAFVKWGTIAAALVAALVVLLISGK